MKWKTNFVWGNYVKKEIKNENKYYRKITKFVILSKLILQLIWLNSKIFTKQWRFVIVLGILLSYSRIGNKLDDWRNMVLKSNISRIYPISKYNETSINIIKYIIGEERVSDYSFDSRE